MLPLGVSSCRQINPKCMEQSFATTVESRNPETDFNLLTIIGCAEYDLQKAEEALAELYKRHWPRLKGAGLGQGWEALGIDVDEIVIRTFERIWTRAGRFNPGKSHPGTAVEDAVSLWIYKIFQNLFRTELRAICRKRAHSPQVLSSDDILIEVVEEPCEADGGRSEESIGETPRVAWTREWLDTLSEGDRQIMLVSADYINRMTGKCEIPPKDLEPLAARLGLAPASIKVKRSRMLERLIELISEKESKQTTNIPTRKNRS